MRASYGSRENGATAKTNVEELKSAGINAVFYESPLTAHEWLSWRGSLHEFAPLLFRSDGVEKRWWDAANGNRAAPTACLRCDVS